MSFKYCHLKASFDHNIPALIALCRRNQSLGESRKVETLIYEIRGQRVMLDSDLARIYGTATGALNRAVKRNRSAFRQISYFRFRRQNGRFEDAKLASQVLLMEGVAVAALMYSLNTARLWQQTC